MAFGFKREEIPSEDLTWLGSKHGVDAARTITLDGAAFADLTVTGHIPSGIAVTEGPTEGHYVPATSPDDVAGFLLTQQKFDEGRIVAPLLDHGRVIASKAPEQSVDVAEITSPHFIIVGAKPAAGGGDNGGAEGNG